MQARLFVVNILVALVPSETLGFGAFTSRLRPVLYRLAGVKIGERTHIHGRITFSGSGRIAANVRIGARCMVTTPLFLNAGASITIGDHVTIGHHVIIITDTHEVGDAEHRCGRAMSQPVSIEEGAWIGARATILPGTTVGRGSVVAAGAVVANEVPAQTLVAGVPARKLKSLPGLSVD